MCGPLWDSASGTSNLILSNNKDLVSGVENYNISAHTSTKHNPSLDACLVKATIMSNVKLLQDLSKLLCSTLSQIQHEKERKMVWREKKNLHIN